jgi:hypothetical protein
MELKMKKLSFILLLLVAAGQAYAYDMSSLKGTITCTSTSTAAITADGQQVTLSGSITIVADGQGNFTSGNAAYYFTQDSVNAACYSTLTVGAYTVNADGSGWATTSWSPASGGTPGHCSQTAVRFTPRNFSIPNGTFQAPTGTASDESGTCVFPR